MQIEPRPRPGRRGVVGDETRVKQILTNLLSNAIKYNVEGGRVHVVSRLADGRRGGGGVSDTGAGMTPEQLGPAVPALQPARSREPADRRHRHRPGHQPAPGRADGRHAARAAASRARARPSRCELPRAGDPRRAAPIDDDARLPSAAYRQRVVHYVEDNETNAEVMRGILALRPQVKLEVSALGLDGLAAIRARRPSLVLLDMHLPDIDGLELLRHLQGRRRHRRHPGDRGFGRRHRGAHRGRPSPPAPRTT